MNLRPLFNYDQFDDAYKYYLSIAVNNMSGMSKYIYNELGKCKIPEVVKNSIESLYGSTDNFIDVVNNNIMLNVIKPMETSIQLLCYNLDVYSAFYFIDKVYILALLCGFSESPPDEFEEWSKDYKKLVPDYWLELRCKNNQEVWEQIKQGFIDKDFVGYYANNTQSAFIRLTPALSYNHIIKLINILNNTKAG